MMKARISQLHKTEAEWNSLPNVKPFAGELIIFDPDADHTYARIKIGDGKTLLKDLPFFAATLDDYISTNGIIDGGRIK